MTVQANTRISALRKIAEDELDGDELSRRLGESDAKMDAANDRAKGESAMGNVAAGGGVATGAYLEREAIKGLIGKLHRQGRPVPPETPTRTIKPVYGGAAAPKVSAGRPSAMAARGRFPRKGLAAVAAGLLAKGFFGGMSEASRRDAANHAKRSQEMRRQFGE